MKTPLRPSMASSMSRKGQTVLGTWVDALGWGDTIHQVVAWGAARESRYICICNVHSVVTATRDPEFKKALSGADLTTSDGAPIAWALRQLGFPAQERIAGPDLMWRYLREAERVGQKVFLYGSTNDTLAKLRSSIAREFPGATLAGMKAPPFCSALPAEDEIEIAEINGSGANVVFVGLGCPKQEKWMAAHQGKINALMIGVGAAFDYHAGKLNRAPLWMQRYGLEWLHRLGSEPRRLMGRYLVTNTLFIVGIARQLISAKILNQK
jgi:N-acetylglucosaminyldiphosphoundecaprenol N-acetyl-beta-D-mannosaminyltransferase